MINFANLFNQFRMNNNSTASDLIDTPGITLDRLMDEESFLNEFKSQVPKVLNFMDYDKYSTLVKYITQVGPPEDRKRSYKFPLSAMEMLSLDIPNTLNYFFGDEPVYVTEEVSDNESPAKQEPSPDAAPQNHDQPDQEVTQEKSEPEAEKIQAETAENSNNPGQNTIQFQQVSQAQSTPQPQEEESRQASPEKEVKTKTIKKEVQPLRFALFSYFNSEVNYTLAGYVCKVFGSLFVKKPVEVMGFLLEPTRMKQLLKHIESRSVVELVVKILTHESTQLLEQRKAAFQDLLELISQPNQVHIICSLATTLCEVIEKVSASVKTSKEGCVELSNIYFSLDIIIQIISNVMSDNENVSVYNAPVLQTYLTNVTLVVPDDGQIVEELKKLLVDFIRKTLAKLRVERADRSTLGFGRMKMVEIIAFVLRENIFSTRDLAAAEPEFFPVLFNLCCNYQYNNVLHNQVVKVVEIALNDEQSSLLLKSLIQDDVLLNFLVKEADEDQKIRSGAGSQKARKGYIGHIISICLKIREASKKNPLVESIRERKQFEKVENLVNKQLYEYNKNLAGFTMKRGQKHTVLFVKEEILQQHMKFLAATPPPVFEAEPEPVNIQHPDLLTVQEQMSEEQQQFIDLRKDRRDEHAFNPRFFQSHLAYDVDELIGDL